MDLHASVGRGAVEPWGFLCAESEHPRGRGLPGSLRCSREAARWVPSLSAPGSHVFLPPGLPVASQDGATGALGPSCLLGPRVPCPVPLAVDTVHSLPQVCPSLARLWCGAGLQAGVAPCRRLPTGPCPRGCTSAPNLCLPGLMRLLPPGSGCRGSRPGPGAVRCPWKR